MTAADRMTDSTMAKLRRTFEQNLCLGTDDGRLLLDELSRARAAEDSLREELAAKDEKIRHLYELLDQAAGDAVR